MPPSAVLSESTIIRTAMTIALNNNRSAPARSTDQHGFGVYQLTTVGSNEAIIHTLVPVSSSAPPCCKALITKLSFRQILGHAGSPSISCSDLVTTIATYFDMSTAMAEREAETAADSIRDSLYRVGNMIGVGFLNSKGKSVTITDPDHRPNDISYFTFRTTVNPHLVDTRIPDSVNLFEFYLRLPNSSPSLSAFRILRDSVQPIITPVPVDTFDSTLKNLTDDNLKFMSATRMRKLLSARHNTLNASRISDTSRILEFTAPPPSATSATSLKTPKMDMICSPSPVGCTYTGTLDFLDDQQSFENIFGSNPVMLIISARFSRAIEDSETLRSKLLDLCSLSHLYMFCDIVQLQYVGTTMYDSNQIMSDISLALSTLKLEYRYKGNFISLTLDDLYRRYIQYLPLLSSNAMAWSFSLVTLFYHTLPLDLQDAIIKDGYRLPNLSLLLTKFLQATVLKKLREHAVVTHKNLADESKKIKKLLSSHLSPRSHSTLVGSEIYHYSNSQAELIIAKHSDPVPSVDLSSKPLVVKKDG